MAKRVDPFDKFREATLGSSSSMSLSGALSTKKTDQTDSEQKQIEETAQPAEPEAKPQPEPSQYPIQVKVSKNADRELVSFHISKDIKKKMNLLKIDLEKPLGDLYNEAIEDLLTKYGRS